MDRIHPNSLTAERDKLLLSSNMKGAEGKVEYAQEITIFGSKGLQRHKQPIQKRRFRGDPINP